MPSLTFTLRVRVCVCVLLIKCRQLVASLFLIRNQINQIRTQKQRFTFACFACRGVHFSKRRCKYHVWLWIWRKGKSRSWKHSTTCLDLIRLHPPSEERFVWCFGSGWIAFCEKMWITKGHWATDHVFEWVSCETTFCSCENQIRDEKTNQITAIKQWKQCNGLMRQPKVYLRFSQLIKP